jgi:hypothetical protein
MMSPITAQQKKLKIGTSAASSVREAGGFGVLLPVALAFIVAM